MRYLIASSMLFIGVVGFTYSRAQPANHKKSAIRNYEAAIQLDAAVRTGKLANGFTYFIRHNQEPKNRVIMYLVNKAGSILETNEQLGLAHFMEHMSFNGTKHFPKNALVDYLQKAGVRFGADINAYTGFDETVYQLPLPSDKPEVLLNGVQIMRDWAQDATLEDTEINKERGVILEEKRLGKGPQERMRHLYWPQILNHSRYADRLPIGTDEVLNKFKPESIRQFYKDWYRPDLQAIVVVGDINVDEMEQTIRKKFADLKNPSLKKPRVNYTIPLIGKNQFMIVTDKEQTVTTAEILFKHKRTNLRTRADYRKTLVRNLFNQMLAVRYNEALRQANPPFLQAGANISAFMGSLDSFDASVTAKPGELEKGLKALWREVERVKRYGFTSTEMQRAVSNYLNSAEGALKEKNRTPSISLTQEYQEYFLKGTLAPGIEKEVELIRTDMPGITLAEVNNLAKIYITDVNRDIIIMAPDKDRALLPNEITVNSWIKAVEQESIQQFKDDVIQQSLLALQPIPGKIVAEEYNKLLNVTTLRLSNGVKIVLKPTDFKNNEVLFNAFAPGGTSLYSDADFQSATNAAGIIASGGAGNLSLSQLTKYLTGKQLGVRPYIAESTQGVTGGAAPKDLETALQLVYAYFTQPRKDQVMFNNIITNSKAGLANRYDNPENVFADTASAILSNNNMRRTGPSIAKIEQMNFDRAYEIYKERFADAAGFTFTFVGSVDINSIKPLLEKYLGSLPAVNRHDKARDLGINIPAGRIEKTLPIGSEPKAKVTLFFSGPFEYSAANEVKMQALKETLAIRLIERLREDEGGVYSPGASVYTSKLPQGRYTFVINFGCAPENADKLIASTLDEINKLRTNGPDAVNLAKFKAEDRNQYETLLKNNNWWLGYLSGQLQNEEDINYSNTYLVDLNKISPVDVKEMAVKYLSDKNFIKLVMLPAKP